MTPLVTSDYFHLSWHQLGASIRQPCSSSAADSLGLEMCVDEIDESEEENNEVLEVDDDSDAD